MNTMMIRTATELLNWNSLVAISVMEDSDDHFRVFADVADDINNYTLAVLSNSEDAQTLIDSIGLALEDPEVVIIYMDALIDREKLEEAASYDDEGSN